MGRRSRRRKTDDTDERMSDAESEESYGSGSYGSYSYSSSGSDAAPRTGVMLGYCEPAASAFSLAPRQFPSKSGGAPAWLNPAESDLPEIPKCGMCGSPLRFIAQLYAPVSSVDSAFHRTVYVFACGCDTFASGPGAAVGGVHAVRVQLPRSNATWPFDPPAAPGKGEGEREGRGADARGEGSGDAFREMEIVIEPERWDPAAVIARAEEESARRIAEYDARVDKEGAIPDSDLAEVEELVGDGDDDGDGDEEDEPVEGRPGADTFEAFTIRVRETGPAQVVRFDRNPGAAPLWITAKNRCGDADVPACEACGAPRQFEFQIMPQMINFLARTGTSTADIPMDWGVVAVYTCSASCAPPAGPSGEAGYLPEFVWRQSIPKPKDDDPTRGLGKIVRLKGKNATKESEAGGAPEAK